MLPVDEMWIAPSGLPFLGATAAAAAAAATSLLVRCKFTKSDGGGGGDSVGRRDETREEGLCMGDRLHMPCALSLLSCERVRNE